MAFAGPTLGWAVLNWMADNLPSPADPTKEFLCTDEQAELVLRWYAVDSETGEFLYRRSELEMAKGWGKSPFAGAIALAEFVGPVLFDHWDGDIPVGRRWDNPWIQIAAVSEDQTDNTYVALYEMLVANDHRAAKRLSIDDGRTRLYLRGRPGRLEPVTASAGSREGQRITFAVLDETHLWTRRNGGVKLAGTLRRNLAKMGGRSLETTNAPLLGQKSVAEQSGTGPGVLYHARRPKVEPDPAWPDDRLLEALAETYGDSAADPWGPGWVDLGRLLKEIRDPETSWDDSTRYYFNIRSAGSGRAVDPRTWDALRKPQDVATGTRIGLGFDGSISQDATVLRGCTETGYRFTVGSWERPAGDELTRWFNTHPGKTEWMVDRAAVKQAVREAHARFDVGLMLCDTPKWLTEISEWAAEFGEDHVIALDTNQARRFAPAVDRWLTAIREGTATHDADPLVDRHVKAAHLQQVRLLDLPDDGRTRYVMVKGDDHGRIDGAVADVLSLEAAMTMPEGEPPSIYETRGLRELDLEPDDEASDDEESAVEIDLLGSEAADELVPSAPR